MGATEADAIKVIGPETQSHPWLVALKNHIHYITGIINRLRIIGDEYQTIQLRHAIVVRLFSSETTSVIEPSGG